MKRREDDGFRTLQQRQGTADTPLWGQASPVPVETRRAAAPARGEKERDKDDLVALFQQHGGMTSDEATERFKVRHPGKDWTSVRPRISELVNDDRRLAATGERRPGQRGKSAAVWDLTERVKGRVA